MKFEDLEVGMLINDGLITALTAAGTSEYWGDSAAVTYFCIQDAYYGQCSRVFHDDMQDFEVLHAIGTPEYEKAVQGLIEKRISAQFDAAEDVKLLRAYKLANKHATEANGD